MYWYTWNLVLDNILFYKDWASNAKIKSLSFFFWLFMTCSEYAIFYTFNDCYIFIFCTGNMIACRINMIYKQWHLYQFLFCIVEIVCKLYIHVCFLIWYPSTLSIYLFCQYLIHVIHVSGFFCLVKIIVIFHFLVFDTLFFCHVTVEDTVEYCLVTIMIIFAFFVCKFDIFIYTF